MRIGIMMSDSLDLELQSCELPCGCWELNLGPLEEQSVLLTTESSHQPLTDFSMKQDFWMIALSCLDKVLVTLFYVLLV